MGGKHPIFFLCYLKFSIYCRFGQRKVVLKWGILADAHTVEESEREREKERGVELLFPAGYKWTALVQLQRLYASRRTNMEKPLTSKRGLRMEL